MLTLTDLVSTLLRLGSCTKRTHLPQRTNISGVFGGGKHFCCFKSYYGPDLALWDLFVFPEVKNLLAVTIMGLSTKYEMARFTLNPLKAQHRYEEWQNLGNGVRFP